MTASFVVQATGSLPDRPTATTTPFAEATATGNVNSVLPIGWIAHTSPSADVHANGTQSGGAYPTAAKPPPGSGAASIGVAWPWMRRIGCLPT